jgi:hypothetical protein
MSQNVTPIAATDSGPGAHVNAQYLVGNRSPAGALLRAFFFASLKILMAKAVAKSSLKVCLLSPHPMVLDEFRRLLGSSGFSIVSKQLESVFASDLRNAKVPRAAVYVNGLLENLANKEVADRLHISERTVKFHVSSLLAKFGVQRRADLLLLCLQRRAGFYARSSRDQAPNLSALAL